MNFEYVQEAVVGGLDNTDPLQELFNGNQKLTDFDGRLDDVWIGSNRQTLASKQEAIVKDTEKAEIEKLREELSKALEVNRTISSSYRELLMRTAEKTPQKSETKRKLCNLLQEELEEKNIYCVNITSKLNNYKKKYQLMKSHIARLQLGRAVAPHTQGEAIKYEQLERENLELKRSLMDYQTREASLLEKLREAESKTASTTKSDDLVDQRLILDKLKAKATTFNRDADKILESISCLKDVMSDLVGTTPSTNWREDDVFLIDIPEPTQEEDSSRLGKRQPLTSEEPQQIFSSQIEAPGSKVLPKVEQNFMRGDVEYKKNSKATSEASKSDQLDAKEEKIIPKYDNGSSEDEESSLSSSFKFNHIENLSLKVKQLTEIDVPAAGLTQKTTKQALLSSSDSFADSAMVKTVAYSTLNSKPTNPMMIEPMVTPLKEQTRKSGEPTETAKLPSLSPSVWLIPQPTIQNVVIPSFLLTNCSKTSLNTKPVAALLPDLPKDSTFQGGKPTTQSQGIKPHPQINPSPCLNQAWNFLSRIKLSGIQDPNQRKEFFSIISSFRDEARTISPKPKEEKSIRKALLDQLLQNDLKIQTYSLKDLMQESNYEPTILDDYHCLVFQSIFFIIYISFFEDEVLSPEEKELVDYILTYRNRSDYLADRFDRLIEAFKQGKASQGAKKPGHNSKNYCYHFPLLKVVFNNMIFSIERMIVPCLTDEEFRSDLLSKKRNLEELKDSCVYVMKKLARKDIQFKFLDGLLGYLDAVKRIFQFSRTLNFNMSKIYFDSFKGFFCHKYRNTSQQLVTFLLLNQLNQLEPPQNN